jgi:signal transduction histidine kinase/ligand-binding sensor domain-containing protein
MRVFLIAAIFLSLVATVSRAMAEDPVRLEMLWRNWTTRDGLPQDRIRAMVRTRDGFLWLGTDAGLARFDGFEFKTYGLHEGLGAVTVLSLLEAGDGSLWVGTLGGGVSVLRDRKVVRTFTEADGLPAESISVLAEDGEGGVWAGERNGVARFNGQRFQPVAGMPDVGTGWLRAMHRTRDGELWLSFSGPRLWIWKDGSWSRGKPPGKKEPTAFGEDPDGRLWIGDMEGLVWCRENGEWTQVPWPDEKGKRVVSMSVGTDGTVWVTWFRSGVIGFRDGAAHRVATKEEPYAGLQETILATPDGQLWLGSTTRGLFALKPARVHVLVIDEQERPGANVIGGLLESLPGEFLIGTQGRGLYRNRGTVVESIESEPQLGPLVFVNAMIPARDGGVWVGTGRGLTRLHGDTGEVVDGMGHWTDVWQLFESEQGLWVGTGMGTLYQVKGGRAEPVDFNQNVPVKGLARQADGTLWVGTRGRGLFAGRAGAWQHYGREQGLPSPVVRVIHVTPDDDLWVGTAGGGLAVKRGGGFVTVTSRDGLPDDNISQIHFDRAGRLWLGTHRGLAVLTPQEVARIKSGKPGPLHPRVIDRFDGLQSEEFTIVPPVETRDGRLAFGTTDGVALLRPEDFSVDQTVPPVFLEEVLVDGRVVEAKDGTIEVPPGAMRVELRYTGLHFTAPARLRFHNRLAGLEDDWGEPGTARTATYRNVAPGHYTFEVSASAGNGLWSTRPAAVKLHFRPHVWQTGWFRAAVVLLALGTVAAIVRRTEQLRSARRIQQLERQRAVDGERARIARDLHDDVGASLTQVALLSQLARNNLTRRPERAGQQVQQIFDTAKEVTRSLDEIVWAVNPQNDTLESFALFLGAFVQNYSHAAGLRCRFDVPDDLPALPLEASIRHHLYLATKEILHNVAKHAEASEIRLALALEPGGFRLTLEDNGRGFGREDTGKPEADGLVNLQSRLQQIGGTCTRRSAPGQGTMVEMKVPLALSAPA